MKLLATLISPLRHQVLAVDLPADKRCPKLAGRLPEEIAAFLATADERISQYDGPPLPKTF
ncbi:MAG: hypothetical protein ACLP50_12160 [Solirubrobacteraceae bacterium]